MTEHQTISAPVSETRARHLEVGDLDPRYARAIVVSVLASATMCLAVMISSTLPANAQGAPSAFAGVRPGQSYAAARRQLLGAGFVPQSFSDGDRCSGRSVCKTYPEAQFCAGTGLANCSFAFRDLAGALVLVETEGEEREQPGREIGLDLGVKTIRRASASEAKGIAAVASTPKSDGPSPQENTTKVEITEDLVTQVWNVSMLQGSPGAFFCEASMRGRNPPAGGDYGIRYRRELGAAPMLIVTYTRPRLPTDGRMVITLDDRRLTTLALRPTKIGRDEAVYATLDTAAFNSEVLVEFEKPKALDFVIGVGGRTFMAPVRGWSIVTRAMDACMAQLRAP